MAARKKIAAVLPRRSVPAKVAAELARARKTVAALIGANATWATAALIPTAHVTVAEWIALGIANATALGVYSVANND